MPTPHPKRAAIVGTFHTWSQTPWQDQGLYIVSLNDAYSLGLPRVDAWWDTHPFGRMWFRPKGSQPVNGDLVPEGAFIRPPNHLQWLKEQAQRIPVYLKETPPADWPALAQRFPIEQVSQAYGNDYWASGPAYIFEFLVLQGFTEIHIYGIHLATAQEYRDQRPNFEFLLGRFLGLQYQQRLEGQTRIYDGANGHRVVLPQSCPLLTHGWRYGYEPKPLPSVYDVELDRVRAKRKKLVDQLVTAPRWTSKAGKLDLMARLQAQEADLTWRLNVQAMASR